MAITTAVCNSFKVELFEGLHNFLDSGGDDIKLALFTSSAVLNAMTTTYSTTNECPATGNYTQGGNSLTRVDPALDSPAAVVDFADEVWSNSTITARGAMIYNADQGDAACSVHDFGSDKSSTSGDFTVVFPTADASNAIIRIS